MGSRVAKISAIMEHVLRKLEGLFNKDQVSGIAWWPSLNMFSSSSGGSSRRLSVRGQVQVVFLGLLATLAPVSALPASERVSGVSRCLVSSVAPNGWPEFASPADLVGNPWGNYVTAVYGEIPNSRDLYPWCMGDQWLFYDSVIEKFNVTDIPPVSSTCPASINKTLNQTGFEGQRYVTNNPFQTKGITWSWHSAMPNNPWAPQQPIANNTWIEVMHREVPKDEKTGAWMFYAPGSGIWANLGNSIVFQSHGQAFAYFNATYVINGTSNNPLCVNNTNITTSNECMSHIATLQGYDSIQFMDTWPLQCEIKKTVIVEANMNYEFVFVKLQGMYTCATESGQSPFIRSGWRGDRNCTCFNNNGSATNNLNCHEVPQ